MAWMPSLRDLSCPIHHSPEHGIIDRSTVRGATVGIAGAVAGIVEPRADVMREAVLGIGITDSSAGAACTTSSVAGKARS